MKDFQKLIMESLEEVKNAGITPGNIVSWKINRRAKRRWGSCTKTPEGHFAIQISSTLLEDDRISEKQCKDTIIHEILHTCKGCMKHTGNWKHYADIMNKTYGYHIKRVSSGEEKGIENYIGRQLPVKYIFCCKNCGQLILRKRESKFTRYYQNYTCGICGMRRAFIKIAEE